MIEDTNKLHIQYFYCSFVLTIFFFFLRRGVQIFQTLKKDLNYISSAMLLLFCERLGGFKTPKPTPTTALDFFSLL